MKNLFKKVLPSSCKKPIKYFYAWIPPRFRYSKVFWDNYTFLQESQWWSKQKLEEYQRQQLHKILHCAYENVPYYQRMFHELGLKPKDIYDRDDLMKLPYLTKKIVHENLNDLVAKNYPKKHLRYMTTGGSTGIPMGFYDEKYKSDAKEWAFIITQWKRVGFNIGDKRVEMRGEVIQPAYKDKFWEYNPVDKILKLSSYKMTNETLPEYIKKIRKFQPKFLHVYPSAISVLARFMKENNIESIPSVKAFLCSSETLYPWQRELLEDVFRCRVYSFYGHSERAVLASECEKSIYYHIVPEYGFVELIARTGKSINKEDEKGEVVATGFNNYAMPFIRYKTGDIAVYSNKKCSCGRSHVLLKSIEGRLQDFFVSSKGDLIPLTGGTEAFFRVSENIKKAQFYQEKKGCVIFRIKKRKTYSNHDSQKIIDALCQRYGNDLQFEIEFVDDIPFTRSGKFHFLIQKLPIKFGSY